MWRVLQAVVMLSTSSSPNLDDAPVTHAFEHTLSSVDNALSSAENATTHSDLSQDDSLAAIPTSHRELLGQARLTPRERVFSQARSMALNLNGISQDTVVPDVLRALASVTQSEMATYVGMRDMLEKM